MKFGDLRIQRASVVRAQEGKKKKKREEIRRRRTALAAVSGNSNSLSYCPPCIASRGGKFEKKEKGKESRRGGGCRYRKKCRCSDSTARSTSFVSDREGEEK